MVIDTECAVKKVSSSKGSDGHTLALTADGSIFSWGDGKTMCKRFNLGGGGVKRTGELMHMWVGGKTHTKWVRLG